MSRNSELIPIKTEYLVVRSLLSVNFFDLSPSFITKEEDHDAWELVYVDSGEISCICGDRTEILKQGDIVFHPPHEIHSTVCNGKQAASIFTMMFESPSDTMFAFAGKGKHVPQRLNRLLKALIDECNKTFFVSKHPLQMQSDAPIGGEQLIRVYMEEFLLLFWRFLRENKESDSEKYKFRSSERPESDALAEEICRYLSENLYQRVTLKMLSEEFHFGKSYLCEAFKKSKGSSIINYHLDLKLTEAKRLLREENIPICDIAERLGFESPEYFSRYFKKRVGHSPGAFRNMLINHASLYHRE